MAFALREDDLGGPRPYSDRMGGVEDDATFTSPTVWSGMTAQPTLWDSPNRTKKVTYRDYLAWRDTPDGLRVWQLVAHMALSELKHGAARTSINTAL